MEFKLFLNLLCQVLGASYTLLPLVWWETWYLLTIVPVQDKGPYLQVTFIEKQSQVEEVEGVQTKFVSWINQ